MALLSFSDILIKAGLDPKRVKLIRHALSDKAFKKCYDKNMVLEYTQNQSIVHRQKSTVQDYPVLCSLSIHSPLSFTYRTSNASSNSLTRSLSSQWKPCFS